MVIYDSKYGFIEKIIFSVRRRCLFMWGFLFDVLVFFKERKVILGIDVLR